jgi:hypothetical protein
VFNLLRENQNAQAQLRAPIFEDKVVDLIVSKAKVKDKKVSKDELLKEDDLPEGLLGVGQSLSCLPPLYEGGERSVRRVGKSQPLRTSNSIVTGKRSSGPHTSPPVWRCAPDTLPIKGRDTAQRSTATAAPEHLRVFHRARRSMMARCRSRVSVGSSGDGRGRGYDVEPRGQGFTRQGLGARSVAGSIGSLPRSPLARRLFPSITAII